MPIVPRLLAMILAFPLIGATVLPTRSVTPQVALTTMQTCALGSLCTAAPCRFSIAAMSTTRNVITAATVDQFIELSFSQPGATGEFGHFATHIDTEMDDANHVVSLTIQGDTMVPAFGPGLAPPIEAALIRQAVADITAHEASHRRVFIAFARQACSFMGRPGRDDMQTLQQYFCSTGPGTYAAADQAVDATDGEIFIDTDPTTGARAIRTRGRWTSRRSHMIQGPLCAQ